MESIINWIPLKEKTPIQEEIYIVALHNGKVCECLWVNDWFGTAWIDAQARQLNNVQYWAEKPKHPDWSEE